MKKIVLIMIVIIALMGCSKVNSMNKAEEIDSVDLKELIDSDNVKDYYGEDVSIEGYAHSVAKDNGETIIGHTGIKGNHVVVVFDGDLDIQEDDYVESIGELIVQEEHDEIFNAIIIEGKNVEILDKE